MTALFKNNAFSTLDGGISDSATSIALSSGDGAKFPAPTGAEYFYATLIDTSNNLEIVKCTTRSTDTLTVTRAQEGTTARAYSAGDRIELRLTAAGITASTALANDYATKIDGAITGSDYSAKAWALGGTGVTDTASAGAAKEWATETSGTVDGTSYSSKEYAQGTQASTGGSAKSWAQDTDQVNGASTNDRSAKNWAQGASMTGSTLGGSSKDWAQTTGGTVDGTNYAAKEWAIGTTVPDGSAKDWAVLAEDSAVTGSSYSALHWAAKAAESATTATTQAGTATTKAGEALTNANNAAASFDSFDDRYLGAKSSDPSVDNDGDALITGALYFNSSSSDLRAYTGSAWVSYGANSAASVSYSNSSSGLSATTAQAAIDEVEGRVDTNTASITALGSGMFSKVGNITTGTTVPHITNDDGRLYLCDTSGGGITVNLPAIGSNEGKRFGFQKTHASNTVTINKNGSDTINGGTSYTLSSISEYVLIVADDNSTDNWVVADLSPVVAGTGLSLSGTTISISGGGVDTTQLASSAVTSVKLDTNAVTSAKINADAITGAKIADNAVGVEHVAGSVNAQVGTTYTLALTDAFKTVTMSNSGTNTLTIPANSAIPFSVGDRIDVVMLGAGATTIAGASGVTVNGTVAGSGTISAQYGAVSCLKIAMDDTWILMGNHGGVS